MPGKFPLSYPALVGRQVHLGAVEILSSMVDPSNNQQALMLELKKHKLGDKPPPLWKIYRWCRRDHILVH